VPEGALRTPKEATDERRDRGETQAIRGFSRLVDEMSGSRADARTCCALKSSVNPWSKASKK
jgi:hypothetical protein